MLISWEDEAWEYESIMTIRGRRAALFCFFLKVLLKKIRISGIMG